MTNWQGPARVRRHLQSLLPRARLLPLRSRPAAMCASADDDTDPLMAPLRGFDERVGVEPIDAAATSTSHFDSKYLAKAFPAVLRGACCGWAAMREGGGRRWDLDFFRRVHGDLLVEVDAGAAGKGQLRCAEAQERFATAPCCCCRPAQPPANARLEGGSLESSGGLKQGGNARAAVLPAQLRGRRFHAEILKVCRVARARLRALLCRMEARVHNRAESGLR